MEVFPDVSIHVAQKIRKGELQHVQDERSIEELEPLLVVKDDKITEYNVNELLHGGKFGIAEDWYLQEVSGLEFDAIEKLERGIGGKLKGMFKLDFKSNCKVTWSAKFEKLTWKKLRNKRSLIKHLTNGKLDIKHTLVESTYYETSYVNRRLGRCPVLKVVDSIVYTNSDTVVSITTEPLWDASVKKEISGDKEGEGKQLEANANYLNSEKNTVKTTLPANTVMAYGCVNLMVDMSNGKLTVGGKGGFCGTPAKDTNCASVGSQPSSPSPGATSSTKEAELNQEVAKLRQANEDLQKLNADKEEKIKERERMLADRDTTIDEKVKTIADKDKTIADKDKTISELNHVIDELETVIKELKEEINGLKAKIEGLEIELANQQLRFNKEIGDHKDEIDSQGKKIRGLEEKFNNVLDALKQPTSQLSEDHINSLYFPAAARSETPTPDIASNPLEEANGRQADDDGTSESFEVTDNDAGDLENGVQEEKPQIPYDRQNEMRRQMQSQPQGTSGLGQQQDQRGPEISSQNGDTESHVNSYVEAHVDRGADSSTARRTQTDGAVLTHEDAAICLYMNVRDDSNSCWDPAERSICTMLIVADENNRQRKHHVGAVYAVAPAHMFLSIEQKNKGAAADSSIINTLREQVLGASVSTTYHLSLETACGQPMNFDVINSVVFGYRYQCLRSIARNPCPYYGCPVEDEVCHHMFMNDMALFPISHDDAVEMQQELKTRMPESVVEEVFNITSLSQFAELHESRTKIEVMHFNGNLEPLISDVREVQRLGKHITFTLESGELGPGTSGALIYIKEKENECRPFGIFVGKLKFNHSRPIYQAVILNQAFKDIEKDYSHLLENIRPFRL